MKDFILMIALAFMLWAWLNFYSRRIAKQKKMDRETRQIALKRFKYKTQSDEEQEQADKAPKKIDAMEHSTGRFTMNAYPYVQQELRSGKERRESRVKVGIIFEYIDRRQADSILYSESDRRNGMDRRGRVWDRRKPKIPSGFKSIVSRV